jgi:hypothetical protein
VGDLGVESGHESAESVQFANKFGPVPFQHLSPLHHGAVALTNEPYELAHLADRHAGAAKEGEEFDELEVRLRVLPSAGAFAPDRCDESGAFAIAKRVGADARGLCGSSNGLGRIYG